MKFRIRFSIFKRVKKSSSAFTLIEILTVIALLVSLFSVVFTVFSPRSARLKKSAYQLSHDIQVTYMFAIRRAQIHRIEFGEDNQSYTIQSFVPPKSKPVEPEEGLTEEYLKELEEWEEAQEKIESLSPEDRAALTRYERGSFETLSEKKLPSPIEIKKIYSPRTVGEKDLTYLLFYPSGEVDHALIILDDGASGHYSLKVNPLSGKVEASKGEITEEEWKKLTGKD